MGKERVKGITVEIGGDTTGLDKALRGTNKQINNTQAQLKDVERLLKLDPTNTELLAQKQRLLSDAVGKTGEKLDTLKEAEKQVQKQFERGDVGQEQYDSLKREIIATESRLGDLQNQARETAKAVSGIDEEPIDEVKRAANKAGDALDDAGKEASTFGDVLKAGAIIEGVKGIAGAISGLNEETLEYRKIMGTLETSSEKAGYTTEQTGEAYKKLYGVLGDDQSAATTLANLQAMGLSQESLMAMIEHSVGAWATYGDSIPIDGLAEAINETVKAGQVTGTFADVLNWGTKEGETFGIQMKDNVEFTKLSEKELKGLSEEQRAAYEAQKTLYESTEAYNKSVDDCASAEDYFNLALANCSTEAERADLIMQAMSEQGLNSAGEAWRKNNEDIVAANESQASFAEKAAELSERVTPAVEAVKEGGNSLLQLFLDITENVDIDAIASGIEKVFTCVSNLILFLVEHKEAVLGTLAAIGAGLVALKLASVIQDIRGATGAVGKLTAAFPGLGGAISALTNPVFLVTAAVVAFVALLAVKGDEIQAGLQRLDDWLQGVFATDWTTVFGPVLGDALNGFFAICKDVWDSVKEIFDGIIDFVRGVFTGDWERAWNGVKKIFTGIFDGLDAIVKAPMNGIIGLLNGAIGGLNKLIRGANKIPGINIGTIGSIPYLANGGTLSRGTAVVGEAGPELLTVSGGQAIVQPLTSHTTNKSMHMGGVTMNIYGAPGQDVNQLAEILMDRFQVIYGQKEAALSV